MNIDEIDDYIDPENTGEDYPPEHGDAPTIPW